MKASEVACEVARVVAPDVHHDFADRQRRAVEQRERERHPALAEVLSRRGAHVLSEQVGESRRRQLRVCREASDRDLSMKVRVDLDEGALDAGIHRNSRVQATRRSP